MLNQTERLLVFPVELHFARTPSFHAREQDKNTKPFIPEKCELCNFNRYTLLSHYHHHHRHPVLHFFLLALQNVPTTPTGGLWSHVTTPCPLETFLFIKSASDTQPWTFTMCAHVYILNKRRLCWRRPHTLNLLHFSHSPTPTLFSMQ